MSDYKLKDGRILRVLQDETPETPNYWDNEDCFLVYDHRQFCVNREGFIPKEIYDYLHGHSEFQRSDGELEAPEKDKLDDYYIWVVFAYIHSGVALSLSREKYPFNDRWDVSSTGFILAKKDEYVVEDDAYKTAEGLIETWNQYLSGQVYGFQVIKRTKCPNCGSVDEDIEDSCWGFYGSDDPRENDMMSHIDGELIKEEVKDAG